MENLLNIHYIDKKNNHMNESIKEIIDIPCKKTIRKAIEKRSIENIVLIILFVISMCMFMISFILNFKKYKLIISKNDDICNSINNLNNFNNINL